MQNQPQRRWVRNSLITFQFFIAIAFIAGAIVIHRQLAFMENTEKGFDPEQVIHFHGLGFYTSPHNDSFHHIRERMAFEPAVLSITATNQPPGGPAPPPAHQFAQGTWDAELDHVGVEAGYFETLCIRMRAGTTFSRTHRLDTSRHYAILNERAVQALDLQDAVGSTVRGCGVEFTIIGIAADSKTYGFERPVNPTVYSIGGECGDGRYHTSVLVRARRGQYQEAADALKKIWREHLPHIDDSFFHYTFLNAEYAALHARQTHLRTVFTGFTVLTILIAGIGLFAMSAYSVSTRQKEISIRKVLGADTWQLFLLLGKPFLLILGIACLLAIPLAAFISDRWLGNFAYRIDLSPMIFVYSCLALLGMVLAIIGYQAGKTSLEPPGRTLRDE